MDNAGTLKMYRELAAWFHLLTAPADYAEEAAIYREVLLRELGSPDLRPTLLELGSGGGNNASHLKATFDCTLADVSPAMLAISRGLNPECEHVQGDMRSLRLGRTFDCVFVHDAIGYMVTEDDLRAAMATAAAHVRPGGVVLFVPDCTRDSFRAETDCGGHDGDGRGMRYLEWTLPVEPGARTYTTEYAYLLREGAEVAVEREQHTFGLFSREEWLAWLKAEGFEAKMEHYALDEDEPDREYDVFLGRRRS